MVEEVREGMVGPSKETVIQLLTYLVILIFFFGGVKLGEYTQYHKDKANIDSLQNELIWCSFKEVFIELDNASIGNFSMPSLSP